MKTIIIIFLLILFWSADNLSQWQITIGGTGTDNANSIIQTSDGGFAVAGSTTSFGAGGYDIYIVKLNSSGNISWSKTIGGSGNDYGYSIIQTTDGGFAVAGSTTSYGAGNSDICAIKLDANGAVQWAIAIGGTGNETGRSIIQTTDGSYAITGETYSYHTGSVDSDLFILKLTGNGSLQWMKTAGGAYNDIGYSIIRTLDGNIAAAGNYTYHSGEGDYTQMWLLKCDVNGLSTVYAAIGGNVGVTAQSLIQNTDSSFVLAGRDEWSSGSMLIVKLNTSGIVSWKGDIGEGSYWYEAHSINHTSDGGYIAAGIRYAWANYIPHMCLVKLNSVGSLQWSRIIGGTNNENANSVVQTNDGGYAVAGSTSSFGAGGNDIYIVKLDSSGNTCGNTISPPSQVSVTSGYGGFSSLSTTARTPTVTSFTSSINTGGIVTIVCSNPAPPPVPILFSPLNNSTGQPLNLTLLWYRSSTAFSYRVQLSTDSTFRSNLIINDSTITDSIKAVSGLSNGTKYYWRVNAKNSVGTSNWSSIWNFTTVVAAPASPTLISPANNSTYNSMTPSMLWSNVSGAVNYRIQINDGDSSFTSPVLDSTTTLDSLKVPPGRLQLWHWYYWHVRAQNAGGNSSYTAVWIFQTGFLGINKIGNEMPKVYKLYSNYPNPFNPTTKIKFDIPSNVKSEKSNVKLVVYDILGNEVATLVNETLSPGTYEVEWNGSNYASGVYFYKLIISDPETSSGFIFNETKKLILLK